MPFRERSHHEPHRDPSVPRLQRDRPFAPGPLGVRAGYRSFIGSRGLYLAPWVGIGYNVNGDPVHVDGAEFERRAVSVFPTIHIGWRF